MLRNKPNGQERPSVIIIGAGIAGMSTGSYLQMNGFNTKIFESHIIPGGCCTAWTRKGFIFDYCIEWMLGSGKNNDANQVWQELGALDGKTVRDFDLFNRVIDESGRSITFYNDPDRLRAHMLALSPKDEKVITSFCDDLRRFTKLDLFPALKPSPLMSVHEKIAMFRKILPSFRLLWRTAATQLDRFALRVKDPFLRRALANIFFQDHECFPMLPYLYNMGQAFNGNAGFPQGGSLGVSQSIAERYSALGGVINFRTPVKRILVENDRAVGIELNSGQCHRADFVVSACDGYTTIYQMLDGKYLSKTISALYDDVLKRPGILYPGVISAFVGYAGEVGQEDPHSTTYFLPDEQAERLPGVAQKSLVIQHRSRYADGFAPPGHSVIHATYLTDFDFWQDLRTSDRQTYRRKKHEIADFIVSFLNQQYPGLQERVKIVEVATPATNKRYTGNMKGAILGWKSFTKAEDLANKLVNSGRMKLPGLSHFYLAGQWIGGGSLVRSALSGRYVAQYLCHELNRKFQVQHNDNITLWNDAKLSCLLKIDKQAYGQSLEPA